jgi:hypothetical protein
MDANPNLVPFRDRRSSDTRTQLLGRIRAEFREMPCLRLTRRQAQRLFGMRADICDRVFATLVGEGFLTCGADARYGLPADLAWRTYSASALGHKGPASKAS